VAYAYNFSTKEVETGPSQPGQPGLNRQSQTKENKKSFYELKIACYVLCKPHYNRNAWTFPLLFDRIDLFYFPW
jgi:hypothetical protein